jgi:hypothetical protein
MSVSADAKRCGKPEGDSKAFGIKGKTLSVARNKKKRSVVGVR